MSIQHISNLANVANTCKTKEHIEGNIVSIIIIIGVIYSSEETLTPLSGYIRRGVCLQGGFVNPFMVGGFTVKPLNFNSRLLNFIPEIL